MTPPPNHTVFLMSSNKIPLSSMKGCVYSSEISSRPFPHSNDTFMHFASPASPFTTSVRSHIDKQFPGAVIAHTSIYLRGVSEGSWAESKGRRGHKGQVSVPSFLWSPSFHTQIKPIKQNGCSLCQCVCVCESERIAKEVT